MTTPTTRKTINRTFTPTAQIQNMRQGYLFAEAQGTPLNTYLTINLVSWRGAGGWKAGATTPEHVSVLRDGLRDMLTAFCRRMGIQAAWVYAYENDVVGGTGLHVHLLMHLPVVGYKETRDALGECVRKKLGWSRAEIASRRSAKLALPREKRRTIRTPFEFSEHGTDGPLSAQAALTCLRYSAKSIDPAETISFGGRTMTIANHADMDRNGHTSREQTVTLELQSSRRPSKCAGVSRLLDAKARHVAGWIGPEEGLEWLSRGVEFLNSKERAMAILGPLMTGRSKPDASMPAGADRSVHDSAPAYVSDWKPAHENRLFEAIANMINPPPPSKETLELRRMLSELKLTTPSTETDPEHEAFLAALLKELLAEDFSANTPVISEREAA